MHADVAERGPSVVHAGAAIAGYVRVQSFAEAGARLALGQMVHARAYRRPVGPAVASGRGVG